MPVPDASITLRGSLVASEQDPQPHASEQLRLYHATGVSTTSPPLVWSEHALQRVSIPERLPTRDEALKVADTVRRYIRQHGTLPIEEKWGFRVSEVNF